MPVEINPLSDALGAEILGADLARGLGDAEFDRIHRAFLDHQVLVIRGQKLAPEDHIAFARRFGDLEPQHGAEYLLPGYSEIIRLSNEMKDGKPIGVIDAGDYWHSDQAFCKAPSRCTVLYALKLPNRGGDTEFAGMYGAYAALPADLRHRIRGLKGLNAISKLRNPRVQVSRARPGAKQFYEKMDAATDDMAHPLVRTHPETGRKSLYLSPRFTIAIEDLDDGDAQPLLDRLFAHQIRDDFIYRHTWRNGDVVMWDNRCVIHRACGGYVYPDTRLLHRVIVTGDVPF